MRPNTRNLPQWLRSESRFDVARTPATACDTAFGGAGTPQRRSGRARRARDDADRAGLSADRGADRHAAAQARRSPVRADAVSNLRDRPHADPRRRCSGSRARGWSRSCRARAFWCRISIRAISCWCSRCAARSSACSAAPGLSARPRSSASDCGDRARHGPRRQDQ